MIYRFAVRLILSSLLLAFLVPSISLAVSEEEMEYLRMYFKDEELVVISATRSLKSISRVAENMTVVTKEDIELMNAHTLADVLNTVTGVQVQFSGASPGNLAFTFIQGSNPEHVTLFMDGVLMNDLANNFALLGGVPIQFIEKVEIVKGPASSAWGSSLGGVINVITKSGGKGGLSGTVSASYGEQNTGDFNAEVYGRKERFGYYIHAGRLQTDGFRPGFDFSGNNMYTKLSYDLTKGTDIVFTLFYDRHDNGQGDFPDFDEADSDKVEHMVSSLSLNTALNDNLKLNLSLRTARQRFVRFAKFMSTGGEIDTTSLDDRNYGAGAKMVWDKGPHNVIVGADYDNFRLISNKMGGFEPEADRWAVYANDTISLGKFSVTPGIRYDNTDTNGEFVSPSLGATYEIFRKTLLRAYVARGFSTPSFGSTFGDNLFIKSNPDLKVEKVWSYQVGAETAALKYLWLRVSAFRHDIRDAVVGQIINPATFESIMVNQDKIRRQGVETEIRTAPLYHTSLSAGGTFYESKDLATGERLRDNGKYSYNIGLKYDDEKYFKALLNGRYMWWDADSAFNAKYSAFVFDLNLVKTLYQQKTNKLEAYLTGHNIFNGTQDWIEFFLNARRWVEAGLKYKF